MKLNSVRQIGTEPDADGALPLEFETTEGTIHARLHPADAGDTAVLWVFGAGGGLGGPAGGVYTRLAKQLAPERVASLRLDYRRPGDLVPCIVDVMVGIFALREAGFERVVLVGHSFGGAVVISAGAASPTVIAVAALSTQTAGTEDVRELSPRPLLLAHGEDDEVLPPVCSRQVYRRAKEPKRLILYPGCRHGLDSCREQLDHDLMEWIRETAALR